MPAIDLGPALDLLLKWVPSIVNAASALITSIKQKRPAAEVAGDAADMLGDVAAVVVPTMPYPDGHPAREAVDLLPDVLAVVADGKVTRAEALAMGQRLLDTGADMLAWAGTLPDGGDEDGEEPRIAVKVAAAVKRTTRKAARRHARPQGQARAPVKAASLAEGLSGRLGAAGMPVPPALRRPPAAGAWDFVSHDGAAIPLDRPTPGGIGDDANPNLDPTGRPPRLGGIVRPPVPDPTVEPPVVEVPPAPAGVDLIGHELVCRMVHFDGLDRIGADVRGLMVAMEDRAIMLHNAQIPELWAMTAPQVAMFEAEERGFLASLVGPTIAAREPHKGSGTALEAREALAAAGVAPCAVLGSCLVPAQYVDGPWAVLVTGAEVGHVRDTEYSGFVVVVPGKVSVQSAATASAAQKSRIAREVGTGALPWGVEVMSISALAPQTGQAHVGEGGVTHYFGTPATKDRADHPDTLSAPAEVAWSRMLDGAHEHASRIVCVGFLEAVEAASRAGVLASGEALYKVVKS